MPIFWQNEVLIISELRYANSKILCPSLSASGNAETEEWFHLKLLFFVSIRWDLAHKSMSTKKEQ